MQKVNVQKFIFIIQNQMKMNFERSGFVFIQIQSHLHVLILNGYLNDWLDSPG
jgi:hypothetical protein